MALASWNDTPNKQTILNFIAAVTSEGNPDFIPPPQRIATFDNDGTLWCEHPVPVQFMAVLDGLSLAVKNNPSLMEKPIYRAAVNKDLAWFAPYMNNERLPELLSMVLEAGAGETQYEYEVRATTWFKKAYHPRFNKPYNKLTFQPILELLDYLRVNDFRVFIVSGGGMDFIRLFSEELYGVPCENVVGGNMKLSWEYRDGTPVLVRQAGIFDPYCDGPGKPINIQLHVGRPPILACGNSNGDVAMLEFAAASGKPHLCLLIHHDDAEREYASEHSSEVALRTAEERNWTIVSMKNDFKTVFSE